MKVILVSGPTSYTDVSAVRAALSDLEPGDLVVHGRAGGLDALAGQVARIMVNVVDSLLIGNAGWEGECRAFGAGDKGTEDCAAQAVAAGISVRYFA